MVVNHRNEKIGQVVQNAHGVNLVIELVGTTLQDSIDACSPGGRVVLVGNLGGKESTIDTQFCRLKHVHIIGGGMLHTSTENERHILELVASKAITPIVAKTMPIQQAAEAHRLLASGELIGKIVLVHSW